MTATRRTVTISITPEQDNLLRACLASGRYHSVSEVMRAGLRLLECQEAPHLHPLRNEGGPSSPPHADPIRHKA